MSKAKQPAIDKLNITELTALIYLAEKKLEQLKKQGLAVSEGAHTYDRTVRFTGTLVRAAATEVTPQFKLENFLSAVLLRYAMTLDEPAAWLNALLGPCGVLGKIIRIGTDKAMEPVPSELQVQWAAFATEAKALFQSLTAKTPRAGNTVVVGTLTPTLK
jgi:hypothetical protein